MKSTDLQFGDTFIRGKRTAVYLSAFPIFPVLEDVGALVFFKDDVSPTAVRLDGEVEVLNRQTLTTAQQHASSLLGVVKQVARLRDGMDTLLDKKISELLEKIDVPKIDRSTLASMGIPSPNEGRKFTPAEQHAEEMLALVRNVAAMACDTQEHALLRGAAHSVVFAIDPPKPVSAKEALDALAAVKTYGELNTFEKINQKSPHANALDVLDRARRAGQLK